MTPFGIILVITAVLSTQVMQSITQPKKYRCISSRPLPQPESESMSNVMYIRVPTLSVTKSSSTASKSPAPVSNSQSSFINSPSTGSKSSSVPKKPSSVQKKPSSVPKTQSSVFKSSSPATKSSSSTVQKVTSKVTNSSRTDKKSPPDSFSLFKLPLKLISSLLVPLIPTTIRQNTSSIISPLFSFQMPLTFSTIHHPNYLPCNTNNSPYPCNSLPGISNNIPISFNPLPGNTNNSPIPSNSIPDNTNTLPTPCNPQPGNTNTITTPCNSLPGNTNTTPEPSNSLPTGNKNNSINLCTSIASNTNNSINVLCNSFLGHSHKSIIFNWFCNFLLNKIKNVSCDIPPTEIIPTPSEPNPPATTDNPNTLLPVTSDFTVTSTEDITTNDNNTPNDNCTPNENNTPKYDTPHDNNIPNNNIPTSTSHYPIPPCIFTPISKIHKPCLPLIHSQKPKPCSVPITHSHSHIPLKYYPPNHAPCSPSYTYLN